MSWFTKTGSKERNDSYRSGTTQTCVGGGFVDGGILNAEGLRIKVGNKASRVYLTIGV
jgi:hypothetical protein